MKIYLASSWRNLDQPRVLALLRSAGHEVYDFRNPTEGEKGFAWSDCEVHTPYLDNEKSIPYYMEAIWSPRAQKGFAFDKEALDWSEATVLLLPCGRSAHLEAGYAAGQGKPVFVYLSETGFEPELMYLLCRGGIILPGDDEALLRGIASEADKHLVHWRDRALACEAEIKKRNYYTSRWAAVQAKHPPIAEAKTKDEILKRFQDFWDILPDSPTIRQAPFFQICDLAEEFCFGEGR